MTITMAVSQLIFFPLSVDVTLNHPSGAFRCAANAVEGAMKKPRHRYL
jgi:hypothetical protein